MSELALQRGLAVQEIAGLDELRDLQGAWRGLWEVDPRAGVFQSPEWLLPWWEAFGASPTMRLWTLAFWSGGELVGLAPLFVYQRQLTLMGNGVSDRLDLLCAPRWERELGRALFETLILRRPLWDSFDFRDLPEGSLLLALPLGRLESDSCCPVLELAAELPKKLRQNLRTARHRAERLGAVEARRATAATLNRDLRALFRLHRARWNGDSMLDGTEPFLRTAARSLLDRGWLRLHVLEIGGAPVAAALCLSAKACACYFIGGFDPAFAEVSPGALVIEAAVRAAREEGCATFDFLRGEEGYKQLWGAEGRPQHRRRFPQEQSSAT